MKTKRPKAPDVSTLPVWEVWACDRNCGEHYFVQASTCSSAARKVESITHLQVQSAELTDIISFDFLGKRQHSKLARGEAVLFDSGM